MKALGRFAGRLCKGGLGSRHLGCCISALISALISPLGMVATLCKKAMQKLSQSYSVCATSV